MKSKFYFFLLLLFSFTTVMSQSKTVTGKVTSGNGEDLSGVTVTIKGTKMATTTNATGQYSIKVPENGKAVLEFSYVGSQSKEVTVGTRSNIDISLVQTSSTLNDVVAVSYTHLRAHET